MVESRNNSGPGKRRSSTNNASSAPESGSGIDAFLKRLDGVDLSKKTPVNEDSPPIETDAKDSSSLSTSITRRLAKLVAAILLLALIYDIAKSPPDKRLIGSHRIHDLIHDFLFWVKEHPGTGAAAFIVVYASCTVLLLPGTVSFLLR
jgi:hypothetical protein